MFDAGLPPALDTLREPLVRMGGNWIEMPSDGDIDTAIRTHFPDAKVICSAVSEAGGTWRIEDVRDPHELNDVDDGIVRPRFAVAETGSVWLNEALYQINAHGYLSQHLVALLDPADIVGNLHPAYHRSELFDANYALLMSGRSTTAGGPRGCADSWSPRRPVAYGHSGATGTCLRAIK